jgi:hypothetical protein
VSGPREADIDADKQGASQDVAIRAASVAADNTCVACEGMKVVVSLLAIVGRQVYRRRRTGLAHGPYGLSGGSGRGMFLG